MTLEAILLFILFCSAFTCLITEAIKNLIPMKNNLIAGCIAIIIGMICIAFYAWTNYMIWSVDLILYTVFIIIVSWLLSMFGYDKIAQTVRQNR